MRSIILNLLLITLIILGLSAAMGGIPSDQETVKFLNRFPSIRIFVQHGAAMNQANAAPGNGHESASILVARRILEMGYKGQVEIIYSYLIKNKMGMLIPGYQIDKPDRQVLSPQLSVTSLEKFLKSSRHNIQVGLAITGADDYESENLAETLNAKIALKLNPKLWSAHNEIQVNEKDLGYVRYLLNDLFKLGYALPQADIEIDPSDVPALLISDVYRAKEKALVTLLDIQSKVFFVPSYNVELGRGYAKVSQYAKVLSELRATRKIASRPIIFGVFSNLDTKEKAKLAEDLNQKLGPEVSIVEVDAVDASDRIKSLSSKQILIVHIGQVPQMVFEKFFGTANLPPMCAGKSTTNFLQYKGIPFVSTHLDEIGDLESTHPGYTVFKDGSIGLRKEIDSPETIEDALEELVIQFQDQNSDLRKFFLSLRQDLISNDKLTIGLQAVQQMLDNLSGFQQRKETIKIIGFDNLTPEHQQPWNDKYKSQSKCREALEV